MNTYKHARTTVFSRGLIVKRLQEGWSGAKIAVSLGISRRTVCKWVKRWKDEGESGLQNRSSRPTRSPTKLAEACENTILHLRRTFLMPAYGIAT